MEDGLTVTEQFKVFKNLMMLAIDDPNGVFNICSKVIISLSLLNKHTDEDFEEILGFMKEAYEQSPTLEETLKELGMTWEDIGLSYED